MHVHRFLMRAALPYAVVLLTSSGIVTAIPVAHAGDPCTLLPATRASIAQLELLGLHDDDLTAMDRANDTIAPIQPTPCVTAGGSWLANPADLMDATAAAVTEFLFAYATDADAGTAFTAFAELSAERFQPLSLPAIGDESLGFTSAIGVSAMYPDGAVSMYRVLFRRGPVVAILAVPGFLGTPPSIDTFVGLAQIIDGRIAASLR